MSNTLSFDYLQATWTLDSVQVLRHCRVLATIVQLRGAVSVFVSAKQALRDGDG